MGASSLPLIQGPGRSLARRRLLRLPLIGLALIGLACATVALPLLPVTEARAAVAGSATVVLRGPQTSTGLARASQLPRSARLVRLHASVPSAATTSDVLARVHALGLTVDEATPWSLAVHGPAESLQRLTSVYGVQSVLVAGGPRPSPAVAPAMLRGPQLRMAYQASSAKPPASTPTPIIATVQFAGWDSSELAGYVAHSQEVGGSAPALPAGEFTAISVAGAPTTTLSEPGSSEVALDQESLYDTDPYAKQRAYFADANPAGLVEALDQVAVDAQSMPGLVALSISWTWCSSWLSGPDLQAMHNALANVVAAGVSVFAASGDDGSRCKEDGSRDVSYPAADPLVVAVGGTSLTLSPTSETAWGAPDPSRISGFFGSGGGVSHFAADAAQTAVSDNASRTLPDVSADADVNTGFYSWHKRDGSGVGWQPSGGTSLASPVTAALYVAELGARGATDGGLGDLHDVLYTAPAADFRDVTSGRNDFYTAKVGYDLVTGLGAPLWGKLVDRALSQPVLSVPATLASRVVPVTVSAPAGQVFLGWKTGFGTAPGSCGTSAGDKPSPAPVIVPADGPYLIWAQGFVGDRHCFTLSTTTVVDTGSTVPLPLPVQPGPVPPAVPPVTQPVAGPGPVVVPVADLTPPVVTLTARRTSLAGTGLSYTWRTTDLGGSGIGSVHATVFRDGRPVWTQAVEESASVSLPGVAGHLYSLAVVASDVAGNTAGYASNTVRLPFDDRSFRLSKGWSRAASRSAFGGSYLTSARVGASAAISAAGTSYTLLTATGPADGIVAVWVDGRHVRDVSLYSRVGKHVAIVLARFRTAGSHRITLVVKGKTASHGRGFSVPVDGLQVL